MLPFAERQCSVMGIDLSEKRIQQAREFFEESGCQARFSSLNVFDMTVGDELYDVILIHDVIEHIGDKAQMLRHVRRFLAPGGVVFIGLSVAISRSVIARLPHIGLFFIFCHAGYTVES